jgi:hypothetical protein
MYRFMRDSGAEISLIQPYVGGQPMNHTHHMVRGITGDLLRAESACEVQFKLGSRCYTHSFVVPHFPIERDGVLSLDWMRSMRVKIDLAHDQLEVADPLRRATVGPKSPDGTTAAEMSVEERRTKQEARKEPPPERECTAEEAKESLVEGQRTLREGCDPQAPRKTLQEGEGMSVEERRTEQEAREEPPLDRERPTVEAKESPRKRRRTLEGGCDPKTAGQHLNGGEGKPPIEKKHGDKVGRECRTMPQQGRDDSAEGERDRNADVCSDRRSTSDERVTSQPRPREAQEISRERRFVRELSEVGQSSDPPEQAEGPLRTQASCEGVI